MEELGHKYNELHAEYSIQADFRMSKPQKTSGKHVEAAKTYEERLGWEERAQYFEELRSICGEDPYELVPSSWNNDLATGLYLVDPKSTILSNNCASKLNSRTYNYNIIQLRQNFN